MAKLDPLFVTVTWGTGGSTAEKSLELATTCERDHGLTTCLHLTCTNMDKKILDKALLTAKEAGIRNILALRGDPPRGEEYWTPNEGDFVYAIDLVKYIRKEYDSWFCIGVAAYPEGHADVTHPEQLNPRDDIPFLAEKIRAGADFILTQLFYDTTLFTEFENMLREYDSELFAKVPLIPAIMPIQSYQTLMRMTGLSHASLPQDIHDSVEAVKHDDEAVKRIGVNISIAMIHDIKSKTNNRVRGSHFCTLNLERSVALTLTGSGLFTKTSRDSSPVRRGADSEPATTRSQPSTNGDGQDKTQSAKSVGVKSSESEADQAVATSEGQGAKGREATWDEYPNGRFGDSRSPAYGELDGWGVSLGVPARKALEMWGTPAKTEDITAVFVKHIHGEISGTPWSNEPLSSETEVIKAELITLNQKQLWTVGSQPAVNCAPSDDSRFGWGPKGGYIFQKSFVEFFVKEDRWTALREKIKGNPQISYYAGTRRGRFESNMAASDANAVTWGIFPGKEIAQPTIIEEVSFKAWREEAFALWGEWERIYEPGSPTARLLRQVMERFWLVSIVHHDYQDEGALWRLFA